MIRVFLLLGGLSTIADEPNLLGMIWFSAPFKIAFYTSANQFKTGFGTPNQAVGVCLEEDRSPGFVFTVVAKTASEM